MGDEKQAAAKALQSLKKWQSYAEQISLLRQRGLIIEDEAAAEKALSSIGYYRLSGYACPFRAFDTNHMPRLDSFIAGSRFSDIAALYAFDLALRLLVLEAMEIIEPVMQTRISHLLGEYSPLAHQEPRFWRADSLKPGKGGTASHYDKWQEDYCKCIKRFQKKPFVKHNLDIYGKLPIWVAVEIFDFGTLSKFFTNMRDKDQSHIAKAFGLSGAVLASWLHGFNFVRNTAAHHARLWNSVIAVPVTIPKTLSNLSRLDNRRPFLYFCLIQFIIKQLEKEGLALLACNWGEKFKNLLATFPPVANQAVTLLDMGCIADWEE